MALSSDGWMSLSGLRKKLGNFTNGELMGRKLTHPCIGNHSIQKMPRRHVSMSLTADVASKARVRTEKSFLFFTSSSSPAFTINHNEIFPYGPDGHMITRPHKAPGSKPFVFRDWILKGCLDL